MFLSQYGKLVAVLTTAKTTLNMPVTVDYVDLTATTTAAAPFQTYTNGTTPVDILSAPAASATRKVNGLTIYGRDTAAKIVRVYKIDATPTTGLITAGSFVAGNDYQIVSVGTTDFTLIGASANTVGVIFTATGVGTGTGTAATAYQYIDLTLQIDDTLCYTDVNGWYTVDSQGNLKSVQAASATAIATAIHGATNKTTPVGADEVGIWDSVSGLLNRVSFTNMLNWFAAKLGNASNAFSVAPATAATHAPQAEQIQSGALVAITATLTGTEYAATPSPALTAYAANQAFDVTFNSACPAAPTIKYNGIATPPNLVRQNVDGTYSNLAAGAFPAGWRSTVRAISASQVLVDRLPPRSTVITGTRDLSLASGSVQFTGAGFKGRKARVALAINGTVTWSIGEHSASGVEFYIASNGAGTGATGTVVSSYCGSAVASVGNNNLVNLTSFDSDGVTLYFTKTGAPTGTITIAIEIEE